MKHNTKIAFKELIAGICDWRVWLLLGWQDIRLRYRRSFFGPFWITISMVLMIYSMGFLYGSLFGMDLKTYFPFLATGFLAWLFILNLINENTQTFIEAKEYLKQIKIPHLVFVLRVVTRNVIIFAHNIVAVIPILIYFRVPVYGHILALFLGLVIIILNGTVYGLILGMLGARFRDVGQIVLSMMQVVFFVTPVMWSPSMLPAKYKFFVNLNPFVNLIDLIRSPLTGISTSLYDYAISSGFLFVGIIVLLILYSKFRHRIVFWL